MTVFSKLSFTRLDENIRSPFVKLLCIKMDLLLGICWKNKIKVR